MRATRPARPENIFFDATNRLVLGDFGLAVSLAHERAVSRVGTFEYMAPEVGCGPAARGGAAGGAWQEEHAAAS